MPIHNDFQKILRQFQARYGDKQGTSLYYAWLKKRGLDDTKAYSMAQLKKKECLNCKECTGKCHMKESFQWAKPLIKLLKKDNEAKYYQVEAHFAVTSMNNNVYTLDELLQAVHTLPGKHVDLNHNLEWIIKPLEITAAMVEDGCSECIIRVPNGSRDAKGRDCQACFEDGTYDCVSIEGDALDSKPILIGDGEGGSVGNQPVGFYYTGLAILDQDALPGIPLTRITPMEKLTESIFNEINLEESLGIEVKEKMSTNTKTEKSAEAAASYCVVCGAKLEGNACPNKDCAAFGKAVQMDMEKKLREDLAKMTEETARLNEEIAAQKRINAEQIEKNELLETQLKASTEELSKVKAKGKEFEGRLRETEKRVSDRDKRIDELEKDVDGLREDVGKLTAARESAISEKNEALSKAAKDAERANQEITERSKIQRELADLREKTAGAIRRESEASEKLASESKRTLDLETELKTVKEEVHKRDEAIKTMQGNNEKAIVEQKRLYKILKENNIYEIDSKGNLVVPS